MTRAVTESDAVAKLRSLMPTDADINTFTIHEVALNKDIAVTLGKEYRLRTGMYTADYTYARNVFKYEDLHVCGFPTIRIQYEWEVRNGVSEYTLPARYECCAIVWDTQDAALTINGHSAESSTQQQGDGVRAVFLSDIEPERTYTIVLTPTDTEESRETTWTVTGAQLTAGHYYVVQCNGKYEQAAHLFALDDMEQGTL